MRRSGGGAHAPPSRPGSRIRTELRGRRPHPRSPGARVDVSVTSFLCTGVNVETPSHSFVRVRETLPAGSPSELPPPTPEGARGAAAAGLRPGPSCRRTPVLLRVRVGSVFARVPRSSRRAPSRVEEPPVLFFLRERRPSECPPGTTFSDLSPFSSETVFLLPPFCGCGGC